jgi:ribosomal protein S2
MVDHVIPANDDAIGSVELIINKLAEVVDLANKATGPEYYEIDWVEVDESVQNMSKKLEDKRLNGRVVAEPGKNQPRVIRVSREQAKRFVK